MAEENQGAAQPGADQPQLALQRVYLKDCSFESPNGPHYSAQEWQPKIDLNLNTKSRSLGSELWEIVLAVRVEAKISDKTAFLVELEQAGAFLMRNIPEAEMKRVVGGYCAGLLFPYAREAISSMVSRGGFPQFLLPPVNFDQLVQQATAAQAAGQPDAAN